jgi:hypothetical protein
VTVGCGVSWSGVTVAVGRGPAGMIGLGIGVVVSLGWATVLVACANVNEITINLSHRLIVTAS